MLLLETYYYEWSANLILEVKYNEFVLVYIMDYNLKGMVNVLILGLVLVDRTVNL